jgi:hypothetical protein
MSRKPQLRSVATAPAASAVSSASSAAFVAPGAALAPASPPEPTRSLCRALLGPRPLIDGEDGTTYDVILKRISADVAPADFVEEIWLRDVVDLTWERVALSRRRRAIREFDAARRKAARRRRPNKV